MLTPSLSYTMSLHAVTENDFKTAVLQAEAPVLVDFWAPWCAPCRVQHPILEELAAELPQIKFASVNVDENSGIAGTYQIMSIPTLIIFHGGKPAAQMIGLQSKEALREKLAHFRTEKS